MTATKATPTPYEIEDATIYALDASLDINRFSATVQPGYTPDGKTSPEEVKATADFMLLACNSHKALVKALAECVAYIEHTQANGGKLVNDVDTEANIAEFRKTVAMVGTGRLGKDIWCDLRSARQLLERLQPTI